MQYQTIHASLMMNFAQSQWLRKQLDFVVNADAQLQRRLQRFCFTELFP